MARRLLALCVLAGLFWYARADDPPANKDDSPAVKKEDLALKQRDAVGVTLFADKNS